MKKETRKKTIKVPRCPKTVTGNHKWGKYLSEIGGTYPTYEVVCELIKCSACGMVDDR